MRPTKGNDRSHDPPGWLGRVGVRVGAVDETLCWCRRRWSCCARRQVWIEAVGRATRRSRRRWSWIRSRNVVSPRGEIAGRGCEHALKFMLCVI